jgi:2'-5' RNA ligase
MGMLRLFAAVPMSTEVTKNLSAPIALCRAQAQGIKWVEPAGMHITLRFFGDTPEERVSQLARVLVEAVEGIAPFEITAKGIGAFPSPSRPRVVWAGIGCGSDELCALAARVKAATEGAGFGEPDGARFSPHVTLGRVRRDANDVTIPPALFTERERVWGTVAVGSVVLYSSTLRPAGPVYRQVALAPLRP